MILEFDEAGGPVYVTVAEIADGGIARTVHIVANELMADPDAEGRLLGVEVLNPALVSRVPEVLKRFGVTAPEGVHFDKLADDFAPTAPAA